MWRWMSNVEWVSIVEFFSWWSQRKVTDTFVICLNEELMFWGLPKAFWLFECVIASLTADFWSIVQTAFESSLVPSRRLIRQLRDKPIREKAVWAITGWTRVFEPGWVQKQRTSRCPYQSMLRMTSQEASSSFQQSMLGDRSHPHGNSFQGIFPELQREAQIFLLTDPDPQFLLALCLYCIFSLRFCHS